MVGKSAEVIDVILDGRGEVDVKSEFNPLGCLRAPF